MSEILIGKEFSLQFWNNFHTAALRRLAATGIAGVKKGFEPSHGERMRMRARRSPIRLPNRTGYDVLRIVIAMVLMLRQSCFDVWHSRPRLWELPYTAEGGCATWDHGSMYQAMLDRAVATARFGL